MAELPLHEAAWLVTRYLENGLSEEEFRVMKESVRSNRHAAEEFAAQAAVKLDSRPGMTASQWKELDEGVKILLGGIGRPGIPRPRRGLWLTALVLLGICSLVFFQDVLDFFRPARHLTARPGPAASKPAASVPAPPVQTAVPTPGAAASPEKPLARRGEPSGAGNLPY